MIPTARTQYVWFFMFIYLYQQAKLEVAKLCTQKTCFLLTSMNTYLHTLPYLAWTNTQTHPPPHATAPSSPKPCQIILDVQSHPWRGSFGATKHLGPNLNSPKCSFKTVGEGLGTLVDISKMTSSLRNLFGPLAKPQLLNLTVSNVPNAYESDVRLKLLNRKICEFPQALSDFP